MKRRHDALRVSGTQVYSAIATKNDIHWLISVIYLDACMRDSGSLSRHLYLWVSLTHPTPNLVSLVHRHLPFHITFVFLHTTFTRHGMPQVKYLTIFNLLYICSVWHIWRVKFRLDLVRMFYKKKKICILLVTHKCITKVHICFYFVQTMRFCCGWGTTMQSLDKKTSKPFCKKERTCQATSVAMKYFQINSHCKCFSILYGAGIWVSFLPIHSLATRFWIHKHCEIMLILIADCSDLITNMYNGYGQYYTLSSNCKNWLRDFIYTTLEIRTFEY